MNHYGLIGFPLSHSFSKEFFTTKFLNEGIEAIYENYEITNLHELKSLIKTENLKGFNVTIPYKEHILKQLDWISEDAQRVKAVNCVRVHEGKLFGYNTDIIGFEKSLLSFYKSQKPALIFGTGGASKAVAYVLNNLQIPYKIVSRNEILNGIAYSELTQSIVEQHSLLVNTTPLGTFPDVESILPITYKWINENHFAFDLVYNPTKTKFLAYCEAEGAQIKNGYEMLILQAEASYKIFNASEFSPDIKVNNLL